MVVSEFPLAVRKSWTVDVTGTLDTLDSADSKTGQRVIVVDAKDVLVHCDKTGTPLLFPLPKTPELPGIVKRSLAELAGALVTTDSDGLPPMPDEPELDSPPPAAGSRDSLKWLPDGAPVSVNGAIVSMASWEGYFYTERSNRTFGIRVVPNEYIYVAEGDLVDVSGTMDTQNGERVVVADGVTVLGSSFPRPTELGMPNRSLGGGAVGGSTPAVPSGEPVGSGLNNTGLLVKTWGRVTALDGGNMLYYIDDGSGLQSDNGNTGIKVCDEGYVPRIGDYEIVTGVSSAEIPYGENSSIRVIQKTWPVTPSTYAGQGTISGTVTATGANGRTAQVYCASALTTALFSGDTANYSLSVPYGDHAVTASVLGYRTTTLLCPTIDSGNQSADLDFSLPSISKAVDVIPAQSRIAPDGLSETTVTAIVRDEEGRRFPNEGITWSLDVGNVVTSESVTNAVGEATATVRSSTNHETGTVTASVGSAVAVCFVQYTSPGDPSVLITDPALGTTASGTLDVSIYCADTNPDGTSDICQREFLIDGVSYGSFTPLADAGYKYGCWTDCFANGTHTLMARATDRAGHTMTSNVVNVSFSNSINTLLVSQMDLFYEEMGAQPFVVTAYTADSVDWLVEVTDIRDDSVVFSQAGSGPGTISATWDGKVNGAYKQGIYSVAVRDLSEESRTNEPEDEIRPITAQRCAGGALILGKISGEDAAGKRCTAYELAAVADNCHDRNVPYTIVLNPRWETGSGTSEFYAPGARRGMDYWFTRFPGYRYFFMTGHGYFGDTADDGQHHVNVDFEDGEVYGTDEWAQDPSTVRAFTDFDLLSDQWTIAWFNTCNSAGSLLELDLSLAHAFGCINNEEDQTFVGWRIMYYPTSYEEILPFWTGGIFNLLSANGSGFTKGIWELLGEGYSLGQAEYIYYLNTFFHPSEAGWMSFYKYIYGPNSKWVTWLIP